jgi:hypothetical protein
MANFPNLEPRSRRYNFGDHPITLQKAWGVSATRFSHGAAATGHRLTLAYELLTAAEAALVRTHYRDQRGGLIPFGLPLAVFRGNVSPTGPAPDSMLWRYASVPQETHRVGSRVDLTVELEAVL